MNLEPNDLLLFARVVDEGSFTPRGRAPRAAQIDGLAPRGGAGSAAGRAPAAAHDAQAHGHRLRPQRCSSTRVTSSRTSRPRRRSRRTGRSSRAAACACRCRATSPTSSSAPLLAEFVAALSGDHAGGRSLRRASSTSIGENFDVAIRMGDLRDDASLAARRLAVFTGSLYAAPAYLARRGTPPEPEALMEHDALRILARTGEPMPWVLTPRRAALGRHSARPRDRQFAGAADAHGAAPAPASPS